MKCSQISLSVLMLFSLSACGLMQQQQAVQSSATNTESQIASVSKETISKVKDFRNVFERNQDVDAPWLAGRSIALAKEVTIPAALRNNVRVTTLASQCTASLMALATCLSASTGIPMRVKPDALMPLALFVPRGSSSSGSAGESASAVRPTSTAASVANLTAQGPSNTGFAVEGVEVPIHKLLSMMDAYWGVSHKLNDEGILEFYRLETRVLRLKAIAQQMNSVSKLNTGFNDASSTTMEIKNQDPVGSMRATLLAMGTLAGDVMISSDTKAVTVTDTPESIARIANYLEEENKRLTRRVIFIV